MDSRKYDLSNHMGIGAFAHTKFTRWQRFCWSVKDWIWPLLGTLTIVALCLACLLLLCSCGDNRESYESPNLDAAIPAYPAVDGEFLIKIFPVSFACYGEPRYAKEFMTVGDVVPQSDSREFDLRSSLQGTFVEYDRSSINWTVSGFFSDTRTDPVSLAGFQLKANRFVEGRVNDETIGFFHRYELGWDLEDGSYYSACVYEADMSGDRRYASWNEEPRVTIDGQWRVRKSVIESSINYPEGLPYTHYVVMDTLSQANSDFIFDLREVRGGYHLDRIHRDPATSAVDAIMIIVSNNMEYETKLWGTVSPDSLSLEYSFRWKQLDTNEELFFQHEKYEGTPRYQPPASIEPIEGEYNANYELTSNDCGFDNYAEHRILDVRPDGDSYQVRVTEFGLEPFMKIEKDSPITITLNRTASGWNYTYKIDGSLDGVELNLTMTIVRAAIEGDNHCRMNYRISGRKRYQIYR